MAPRDPLSVGYRAADAYTELEDWLLSRVAPVGFLQLPAVEDSLVHLSLQMMLIQNPNIARRPIEKVTFKEEPFLPIGASISTEKREPILSPPLKHSRLDPPEFPLLVSKNYSSRGAKLSQMLHLGPQALQVQPGSSLVALESWKESFARPDAIPVGPSARLCALHLVEHCDFRDADSAIPELMPLNPAQAPWAESFSLPASSKLSVDLPSEGEETELFSSVLHKFSADTARVLSPVDIAPRAAAPPPIEDSTQILFLEFLTPPEDPLFEFGELSGGAVWERSLFHPLPVSVSVGLRFSHFSSKAQLLPVSLPEHSRPSRPSARWEAALAPIQRIKAGILAKQQLFKGEGDFVVASGIPYPPNESLRDPAGDRWAADVETYFRDQKEMHQAWIRAVESATTEMPTQDLLQVGFEYKNAKKWDISLDTFFSSLRHDGEPFNQVLSKLTSTGSNALPRHLETLSISLRFQARPSVGVFEPLHKFSKEAEACAPVCWASLLPVVALEQEFVFEFEPEYVEEERPPSPRNRDPSSSPVSQSLHESSTDETPPAEEENEKEVLPENSSPAPSKPDEPETKPLPPGPVKERKSPFEMLSQTECTHIVIASKGAAVPTPSPEVRVGTFPENETEKKLFKKLKHMPAMRTMEDILSSRSHLTPWHLGISKPPKLRNLKSLKIESLSRKRRRTFDFTLEPPPSLATEESRKEAKTPKDVVNTPPPPPSLASPRRGVLPQIEPTAPHKTPNYQADELDGFITLNKKRTISFKPHIQTLSAEKVKSSSNQTLSNLSHGLFHQVSFGEIHRIVPGDIPSTIKNCFLRRQQPKKDQFLNICDLSMVKWNFLTHFSIILSELCRFALSGEGKPLAFIEKSWAVASHMIRSCLFEHSPEIIDDVSRLIALDKPFKEKQIVVVGLDDVHALDSEFICVVPPGSSQVDLEGFSDKTVLLFDLAGLLHKELGASRVLHSSGVQGKVIPLDKGFDKYLLKRVPQFLINVPKTEEDLSTISDLLTSAKQEFSQLSHFFPGHEGTELPSLDVIKATLSSHITPGSPLIGPYVRLSSFITLIDVFRAGGPALAASWMGVMSQSQAYGPILRNAKLPKSLRSERHGTHKDPLGYAGMYRLTRRLCSFGTPLLILPAQFDGKRVPFPKTLVPRGASFWNWRQELRRDVEAGQATVALVSSKAEFEELSCNPRLSRFSHAVIFGGEEYVPNFPTPSPCVIPLVAPFPTPLMIKRFSIPTFALKQAPNSFTPFETFSDSIGTQQHAFVTCGSVPSMFTQALVALTGWHRVSRDAKPLFLQGTTHSSGAGPCVVTISSANPVMCVLILEGNMGQKEFLEKTISSVPTRCGRLAAVVLCVDNDPGSAMPPGARVASKGGAVPIFPARDWNQAAERIVAISCEYVFLRSEAPIASWVEEGFTPKRSPDNPKHSSPGLPQILSLHTPKAMGSRRIRQSPRKVALAAGSVLHTPDSAQFAGATFAPPVSRPFAAPGLHSLRTKVLRGELPVRQLRYERQAQSDQTLLCWGDAPPSEPAPFKTPLLDAQTGAKTTRHRAESRFEPFAPLRRSPDSQSPAPSDDAETFISSFLGGIW